MHANFTWYPPRWAVYCRGWRYTAAVGGTPPRWAVHRRGGRYTDAVGGTPPPAYRPIGGARARVHCRTRGVRVVYIHFLSPHTPITRTTRGATGEQMARDARQRTRARARTLARSEGEECALDCGHQRQWGGGGGSNYPQPPTTTVATRRCLWSEDKQIAATRGITAEMASK